MKKAKIKLLHPNAKIPKRMTEGASGYDVYATGVELKETKRLFFFIKLYKYVYSTGIAIEPPKGYDIKLFPRSSVHKGWAWLSNSVGLGDPDYIGEYLYVYYSFSKKPPFNINDRIGQLIFQKKEDIEFVEVSDLSPTKRGDGGFGHTGK